MGRIALIIALFLYFLGVTTPAVFAQADGGLIQDHAVCSTIADGQQQAACNGCMSEDGTSLSVWTAIGCIQTKNPEAFLSRILRIGIGMAGGIAFLLILFAGLQIMTSAGNPEHLNAGKELMSASITGLLLVIFSIFILRFIGMDIIGIPGFGGVSR